MLPQLYRNTFYSNITTHNNFNNQSIINLNNNNKMDNNNNNNSLVTAMKRAPKNVVTCPSDRILFFFSLCLGQKFQEIVGKNVNNRSHSTFSIIFISSSHSYLKKTFKTSFCSFHFFDQPNCIFNRWSVATISKSQQTRQNGEVQLDHPEDLLNLNCCWFSLLSEGK